MDATRTAPLALHHLPEKQWAAITDVATPQGGADHGLVLRLVELGFVKGERVRIVGHGLGGRDTLAVRLGHTTFGLRRHEASFILVQPIAA